MRRCTYRSFVRNRKCLIGDILVSDLPTFAQRLSDLGPQFEAELCALIRNASSLGVSQRDRDFLGDLNRRLTKWGRRTIIDHRQVDRIQRIRAGTCGPR
jgi:hypothetical protein